MSIGIGDIALAEKFDDASGLKDTGKKIGFEYGDADTGKSIAFIIGLMIRGVLAFIGIIFMVLILMGAFDIQSAGGNEEAVQKGKQKIKNGAIGLLIIMAAYLVSYIFLGWLTGGENPIFKI